MQAKEEPLMCALCNVPLPNAQTKISHVLGKKHQLALHRDHMVEVKEKCGIFVSGFPNLLKHDEIISYFSSYGKIVDHYFGDDNRFAIIQFSSEEPVEKLLNTNVIMRGRKLQLKRRLLKGRVPGRTEPVQPQENFEEINENLKNIPNFHMQVLELIRCVQPNLPGMIEEYKHLCADLQNILREAFPGCNVHPFGSTVTGLGFTTSDVDIYVEVLQPNGAGPSSGGMQFSHATICVNKAKKLLQKYGRIFSQLRAIPRAKTPIVKCVHNPTKISCDFNFKNLLGVCNSSLIQYYLSLDTKLKSVMIILKYWGKVHELSGSSGRFSNYGITMLLIFYLQQNPYLLPPVISLQESHQCRNPQEGWNGEFIPLRNFISEPLVNQSVSELLQGFFDYYSNFDYTLNIICPYLGRIVPKTDFLKPELLSDEFERYKNNVSDTQALRMETSVCIQDPFEHTHNVSSSVPQRLLEEFVGFCKLGSEIFSDPTIDSSALYRLFTEEIESIDFKKYVGNDAECKFKIPMGNHLVYLNHEIVSNGGDISDPDEKRLQIQRLWYNTVNKFIITFLTNVMKFTVNIEKDSPHVKSQRLNGQNDVHDTNVVDSVGFHCTGEHNLWEARKPIARDMNLDESLTFIEKQIEITNYICNVLYKGLTLKDVVLEVNINMHAKINPTEMVFHLTKINARKGCFKSFAAFLAKNVPIWFEKHIVELDKQLKGDTEADETEKSKNEESVEVQSE